MSVGTISPRLKPTCPSTHGSDCESHCDDNEPAETTLLPRETGVDAFNLDGYLSSRSSSYVSSFEYLHHQPQPHHSNFNEQEGNGKPTIAHFAPPPSTSVPATTTAAAADAFNIDDYLSSDAESLTAEITTATTSHKRRPTAEGEEELLYNDSGVFGMQLPGLADAFLPTTTTATSTSAIATRGQGYGQGQGGKYRNGVRRSSLMVPLSVSSLSLHAELDRAQRWEATGRKVGGRRRRAAVRRRFILDTAAHYEEAWSGAGYGGAVEGEDWEEEEEEQRERRLRLGLLKEAGDDDDGYEADYIEDEDEGLSSRRRQRRQRQRQGTERTTRRMSALCCRVEGGGEEEAERKVEEQREGQQQQQQQQSEQPNEKDREKKPEDEEQKLEDKIAAAVRLRKEVRRARRLAGQPSAGVLRQRRSVNQYMGEGMSTPVLREG
jgi:hypothetical protein